MHDRRIDGEAVVFGNQGALFMNAMTWFDHITASIWSQPWGLAIEGELKGTRLQLLPMSLVEWGGWKMDHPDTLVLDLPDVWPGIFSQLFRDDFVIGVALGDHARSFPFLILAEEVVVNDAVGPFPIVLYTSPESRNVQVFVRQAQGQVLTFVPDGMQMRDRETGSLWDPIRGLAVEGPLRGQGLQRVPGNSSADWAWRDFYPKSTEYQGRAARN
ncbi:MAG: DUF3179 domain-containing protein [Chloroflexi bacterium]|nr:DUF3179 domain-containing protein [Chloroflexota bacterium]MCI0769380.1 DUF3179 domain-containing protein [Chloroflexota bacterium]